MKTNIYFWTYLAHFFLNEILSDKSCTENQTHILWSVTFFFADSRAVYKKMWENIVES